MKKILILIFCVATVFTTHAQVLKKIGTQVKKTSKNAGSTIDNKVQERTAQKTSEETDKAIDKVFTEKKKGKRKNKGDQQEANTAGETIHSTESTANNITLSTDADTQVTPGPVSLKSYSKFDFVPGEKLVASEDFSQDAVGDFPAKWNTNGSGEVVTTNKGTGKYLVTQKDCVFYPDWIKDLPDNFTAEFDILCTDNFGYYSGDLVIGFTTSTNVGSDFYKFNRQGGGRINDGGGFEVGFHPKNSTGELGSTSFYSSSTGSEFLNNRADQDRFIVPQKPYAHISIWRQKTRVRVYIDEKKVWDLPKGIADGLNLQSVYFRNNGASGDNDAWYLSNFKLATGAPDTRNKLITDGKFVSHGILFDVNSDEIKPGSYGTIKDIATVLNESNDVNVLIVGHTDSDGSDAANLELSKKRAAAVKTILVSEFSISASRLSTDGKGESQPIDNNTTTLGKANNRRVEFIKQ